MSKTSKTTRILRHGSWFLLAGLLAGGAGCGRTAPQPMIPSPAPVVVEPLAATPRPVARPNRDLPPLTADPPEPSPAGAVLRQRPRPVAVAKAAPPPAPAPAFKNLPVYVPTEIPTTPVREPLWKQRQKTY